MYVLLCADNSMYCGITNDVQKRLVKHRSELGSKYVRSRLPVRILAISPPMSKSDALKREAAFKKLHTRKKMEQVLALRQEHLEYLKANMLAPVPQEEPWPAK